MRLLGCSCLRKLGVVLLPSLLLILYLTLSDYMASTAHLVDIEPPSGFQLRGQPSDVITLFNSPSTTDFSAADLDKRVKFSTAGDGDVMVFLHMQKTGGTFFGRNLVKNLQLDSPCSCVDGEGMLRCPCKSRDKKRYWLFSRYSTGWKCGLHADFTELSECLAAGRLEELEQELEEESAAVSSLQPLHRRYYYISVLREPLQRYVSEWMHVARGASWSRSYFRCNGRSPTILELPPCHAGLSWDNVTIEEFVSCPYNLARNRQTRMLANLTDLGCYSVDMMDNPVKKNALLESAKANLRSMPYFAIMAYLSESQSLFEWTFNLKFKRPMTGQKNRHNRNSGDTLALLPPSIKEQIAKANDLDIKLYKYALELFVQRYKYSKQNPHPL